MGLDLPELDDREYDDLLEQAKKLIPAYSDQWTDFNPHDPGMTILEILAWLTETHTYQLDQVTDAHREKFLHLVGHEPQPPTAATVPLALSAPEEITDTRLPAGTRLTVTDGTETNFQFETDQDLVLTAAAIEQVYTVDDSGVSDQTEANETEQMFYLPFGDSVDEESALYLGFDQDPFGETGALTLSVSFHDDNLPEPNPPMEPGRSGRFEPSVELRWDVFDPAEGSWYGLDQRSDGTNALYDGGPMEFELSDEVVEKPPRWDEMVFDGLDPDGYWLRCGVETPGYEIPPQIESISTNVVTSSHRARVTDEQLHQLDDSTSQYHSPSLDGQTYAFDHEPVLAATVSVDDEEFTEVPDFDASGPDDRHYVLDRERGTITFGDGAAGEVPPPDATVTATYVYGGGDAGNVSEAAVWRLTDPSVDIDGTRSIVEIDVEPLEPASGGEDGETIDDALRRARRDLRRPYRAVTADDYQSLAAATPGLRIGRTNVWIDEERATVIVVPYAPKAVRSPTPSDAFLETVRSHLRERTLLTDRLTVSGPRYVRLELTITGTIRKQYAQSGYDAAITDAIESYLHPLYGFDGDGWPFGRALTKEALQAEIQRVDAVDHVSDIRITAHGGRTIDDSTVQIDETALFSVETVSVDMRPTSDGGG